MFWTNFILLCDEHNVKPNVVARECGVKSSGTVTGWRNGSMPRQSVLIKIAQYFSCDVDDLITDKKIPATPKNDGISNDSIIRREELKRLVDRLTDQEVADYLSDFRRTILGE